MDHEWCTRTSPECRATAFTHLFLGHGTSIGGDVPLLGSSSESGLISEISLS